MPLLQEQDKFHIYPDENIFVQNFHLPSFAGGGGRCPSQPSLGWMTSEEGPRPWYHLLPGQHIWWIIHLALWLGTWFCCAWASHLYIQHGRHRYVDRSDRLIHTLPCLSFRCHIKWWICIWQVMLHHTSNNRERILTSLQAQWFAMTQSAASDIHPCAN